MVNSYSLIPFSPNRLKIASSDRNSTAYPRASPAAPPTRHPLYLSKFFVMVPPCWLERLHLSPKKRISYHNQLHYDNSGLPLMGEKSMRHVRWVQKYNLYYIGVNSKLQQRNAPPRQSFSEFLHQKAKKTRQMRFSSPKCSFFILSIVLYPNIC